jgi:hypothetical protein
MKTIGLILIVIMLQSCENLSNVDMIPPSSPSGLSTQTGDNFIELFWNPSPEADVAGYHVYLGPTANGPYVMISSVGAAYFADLDARNGNAYYYAVSAFDNAGNESELSPATYDIPRPEGYNVVLYNYHQVPEASGYDFSTYTVVPNDDLYTDMYFEYYQGEYYMVVRSDDTDIQDMGYTTSLLDIPVAPAAGWSPSHDVRLIVGHTYVVWTWDDHYAKFRVTSLSSNRVVFDWAYQLQESNPLLKRAVPAAGRSAPPVERSHD